VVDITSRTAYSGHGPLWATVSVSDPCCGVEPKPHSVRHGATPIPPGSVTSPLWKGRVGCCGWKDGGEGGGCTPCESIAVLLYCTAVLLYSYGCTEYCCTVVFIAVLRYSCIACTGTASSLAVSTCGGPRMALLRCCVAASHQR
jgi:hypothetical protein